MALVHTSAGQQADVQNLVTSGKLEGMRWPDLSDYRVWLQKFYEPAGYAPWLQGTQLVPQAQSLIDRFKDAGKKGLDPEDYDASRWEERIRSLRDPSNALAVARFDVALTVCTMRYVSDLRIGRINPQHFKFGLSVEQKKYDLAPFVRDRILVASNLQAIFDGVEPPFPAIARPSRRSRATSSWRRAMMGKNFPKSKSQSTRGRPTRVCHDWSSFLRLVGDLPAEAGLPRILKRTADRWWMRSNASSAAMA